MNWTAALDALRARIAAWLEWRTQRAHQECKDAAEHARRSLGQQFRYGWPTTKEEKQQ